MLQVESAGGAQHQSPVPLTTSRGPSALTRSTVTAPSEAVPPAYRTS